MRDFGLFLLAIAATIAMLATIDPTASSPRQTAPLRNNRAPEADAPAGAPTADLRRGGCDARAAGRPGCAARPPERV
jgi:hypothetical protein